MFFYSTFKLKLDEKSRFFLPTRFRPALKDGLVITHGQEYCLSIFEPATFEKVAQGVMDQQWTQKSVRGFARVLAASAWPSQPDGQGRVTIGADLREYAHLEKDIVVTGALDHIEIWNPLAWDGYAQHAEPDFADIDTPSIGLTESSL